MSENSNITITEEQLVNELISFIEEKKSKKEPSKADGLEFERLWLALTESKGIDNSSVSLLCDGFRYRAARPLFVYYKKSSSSSIPYTTLGSYAAFRANSAEIMLRIYLSLFACELSEPTSPEQIAWLVKRIPDAALNKEGKTSGNMGGYVRKLLVQEVAGQEVKAGSVRSELSRNEAARFSQLIAPVLEDIGKKAKLTASERIAVKEIAEWIESLREGVQSLDSSIGHNPIAGEAKRNDDECASSVKESPMGEGSPGEEIDASQVIAFVQRQERRIEALRSSSTSAAAEANRLKEDRKSLSEQNSSLQERLEKAHDTIASQNARIAELEKQLDATSTDLAAHKELVEMLDQDKAKQGDEAMTRVSRKLRIEYQDYQDAADMDMSVDLGENMRLQLGEVFRILEENGFEL